jgi:hypothetical protein
MNHTEKEKQYLELIQQFLQSEVESKTSCHNFFKLRRKDRELDDARQASWPERYDLQLIAQLKREELTKEEFSRKWAELWGYQDYVCLYEMLDRVFTVCDCYSPSPSQIWEIDEKQLMSEIKELFYTYKTTHGNLRL